MLFAKKKPLMSARESLAAKPMRLVTTQMQMDESGAGRLKVPLRQTRWTGWLFRMPEQATKTFEFDAMGILVWEQCDGKTSVQQIIRKLAKRYNLSLREAEVCTRQFLQMLARKGLVGMAVKAKESAGSTQSSQVGT